MTTTEDREAPSAVAAARLDAVAWRADRLLAILRERHGIQTTQYGDLAPSSRPPHGATTPIADAWRVHDVSNAADALAEVARGNGGTWTMGTMVVQSLTRILVEVERREHRR